MKPRNRASVFTLLGILACILHITFLRSVEALNTMLMSKVRVELFFKDNKELRERVQFLAGKGVRAFNLVNKNKGDVLNEWVAIIREEVPDSSVCAHFSLKFNKSGKRVGADDANYGIFSSFIQTSKKETEVLLISGSGKKINLDSVNTLCRLKKERAFFGINKSKCILPQVAVAFNPFFPSLEDQKAERQRLILKLDTEQVSKVYLQFGSDLNLLRSSLEWLTEIQSQRKADTNLAICGSVFLPTAKLIAQQKFRPWNGVFLCEEFLGSTEGARGIVLQMMKLYEQFNVEILIEAPGVRNEKDFAIVESLLLDRDTFFKQSNRVVEEEHGYPPHTENREDHPTATGVSKRRKFVSDTLQLQQSPLLPLPIESLQRPAILLFGSFDVRLHDNRAVELASHHSQVIPVFLWNKTEQGRWGVRGALEVVLKDALRSLSSTLESRGLQLICRDTNDTTKELFDICRETGAGVVYWNREHTSESRVRDKQRKGKLLSEQILVVESQSSLLYDPEKIELPKGFNGGHWGTLMPFLKGCKKQFGEPRRPAQRHQTFALLENMKGPDTWPWGVAVKELSMAVIKGPQKWDETILKRFPMSEEAAASNLKTFFSQGFAKYEQERNRADLEWSTSRLSTHLRIGTLSPNELYFKTEDSTLTHDEKKTFSRRLVWRDLAYFQLHSFPLMREQSIRKHYEKTEWVTDSEEEQRRLEAWKYGKTGYPLVDAGMRELYSTGWMAQTIRMVVASFLVEYLRVNWTKGCEWFHYTLVDADSAINAMMWQNAGRSGIDQWNFIMSPVAASQDKSGDYTRKWVPELSELSTSLVHTPWLAAGSGDVLDRAGVILGETYPHRIVVDLKAERSSSVESVLRMRGDSQAYNDSRGYDLVTLPSGDKTVVFTKKEYRIDREGCVLQSTRTPASQKRALKSTRKR